MAIIVHADLDAFFASCEHLRRDEDRPIVTCIYSDRGGDSGAVSSADYAARDLGIHAGMPIITAKQAAAEAGVECAFVAADKSYYKAMSEQVMDAFASHVDEVQVASIDEAYADISSAKTYSAATTIAERIKNAVKAELGLTVSIGVGPNKLVAKMASDLDKPDGLTVVEPDAVQSLLDPMDVGELHGVGPKTAETLKEQGVETIRDLRQVPAPRLISLFGEARGTALYRKARGDGSTELEHREKKQLSRMTTLPADTRDIGDLRPVIRDLAQDVHARVEQRNVQFGAVTIVVVTTDRDTRSRTRSLPAATGDLSAIYETAEELVQAFVASENASIRRIGVRVSDLSEGEQTRLNAFGAG